MSKRSTPPSGGKECPHAKQEIIVIRGRRIQRCAFCWSIVAFLDPEWDDSPNYVGKDAAHSHDQA